MFSLELFFQRNFFSLLSLKNFLGAALPQFLEACLYVTLRHKVGINVFNKISINLSKTKESKNFFNKYWHLSSLSPTENRKSFAFFCF